MAQGAATSTGYPEGIPTRFLASHETSRVSGSTPVDAQDATHALIGPFDGRKALVTNGTRVALATTTKARYVIVQYAEGSSGIIVVGAVTCVAALATRRGFALYGPGDFVGFEINDLADVYFDSTVDADAVTFLYWTL